MHLARFYEFNGFVAGMAAAMGIDIRQGDDWDGDPHHINGAVHYRLYAGKNGPTIICAQDFDYCDYDARRILSPDGWDSEAAAEAALIELLPAVADAERRIGDVSLNPDLRAHLLAHIVRSSQTDPERSKP